MQTTSQEARHEQRRQAVKGALELLWNARTRVLMTASWERDPPVDDLDGLGWLRRIGQRLAMTM